MITTVTMNASIDKAYFMDHTIEMGLSCELPDAGIQQVEKV